MSEENKNRHFQQWSMCAILPHYSVASFLHLLHSLNAFAAETAAILLVSYYFLAFIIIGVFWFKEYRKYNFQQILFYHPWGPFSLGRIGGGALTLLIFALCAWSYLYLSADLVNAFQSDYDWRYYFGYSCAFAASTTLFYGVLHAVMPPKSGKCLFQRGPANVEQRQAPDP